MKKLFILAILFFSVATCKKSSSPLYENSSIIGKWKLSESLSDPGDGSGTYQPADPLNPVFIEFRENGTLIMTPYNLYADHYELTSDSTMIIGNDSTKYTIRYQLTSTLLTLHPLCYEPCGERFVPINK